jgi:hypothetical protein
MDAGSIAKGYKLQERIGAGGFGAILAEHDGLTTPSPATAEPFVAAHG